MHELVRAELVCVVDLRAIGIFSGLENPGVRAPRTFAARPNAAPPVVPIGEASAGPAHHAGLNLSHLFDQRASDAADVGNFRFLAHPNAVVDDAAKVLDEVAINFRRNRSDWLVD